LKGAEQKNFPGVFFIYLEVAHIAHEDIRQRELAFRVVTPVVASNV
jgi:hypothetical protein